jgi:hypothetical protein
LKKIESILMSPSGTLPTSPLSKLEQVDSPKSATRRVKMDLHHENEAELQDQYEGEWACGLKHGNGTEKFANGDFYIGNYRQGEFEGSGKYVWKNGSSYQG